MRRIEPISKIRLSVYGINQLALSLLFILPGCATSNVEQLNVLNSAQICCETLQSVPITTALEKSLQLKLTTNSPVFGFSTGRSAFVAFSLPKSYVPYQLELRTLPMGRVSFRGTLKGGQQYLYPTLLFLDDRLKEIGTAHDENLLAECYGFGCTYTFIGSVKVPPLARYAILHTLFAKIDQEYEAPMSVPGGGFIIDNVPVLHGEYIKLWRGKFGATGEVIVTVKE